MTRRPKPSQPYTEEAHAAMARVFGVDVQAADAPPPSEATAPEPPADDRERRAALGRVFGTEA
jgi:hypothetical protein